MTRTLALMPAAFLNGNAPAFFGIQSLRDSERLYHSSRYFAATLMSITLLYALFS